MNTTGKQCGAFGYKTKAGKPCGYFIAPDATSCPHHTPGGSTAKAFQEQGMFAKKYMRIPDQVAAGTLRTAEEIREVYASIITEATTRKSVDLRRLDTVLKCLSGASTLLQIEALKELNDTVLRAEGHGPALVVLEGLKAGRTRRLPGVKVRPLEPIEEAQEG